MIVRPGFYDLSADDYFADPCPTPSLTQSGIPTLLKNAQAFARRHPRLNPYGRDGDPTRAMWFGSAVHRLALGKGKEVSILKFPDFKSSTAREQRDGVIANGRIPVLERDYVRALDAAGVVRQRIAEALEGAPYETEVAFAWVEETVLGPVWCRGMLDVWCPARATVLDVKTTARGLDDETLEREIGDNGYDVQRAFYRRGVGRILPDLAGRVRFENLFVESDPPHQARAIELDEASTYVAEQAVEVAVRRFAQCLSSRSWPGLPRRSVLGTTPYHQARLMRELQTESING